MPYVSCHYAPPDETLPGAQKGVNARIVCVDERGTVWHLTEDSQVGDWLRFKEAGGTVDPYVAPAPVVRGSSSPPQYIGEVSWQ